jgi:hypothetical protein
MKQLHLVVLTALSLLLAPGVHAQTTAFTYQGRINQGTNAARGTFDMQFSLFNVSSGGAALAGPLSATLAVTDGLFSVPLDFGSVPFSNGQNLWLQISVRTNGVGVYTNLSPRQALTSTPYAIHSREATLAISASTATSAATVTANGVNTTALQDNSITAAKIAGGQVVKSLNGLFDNVSLVAGANLTLTPVGNTLTLASPTWSLTGNSGTGPGNFLGTTDNQPLALRANNMRGLQLEYTSRNSGGLFFSFAESVNVIGGYSGNIIPNTVIGGVIAGGGDYFSSRFGVTLYPNAVIDDFGAIGGGYSNVVGYAACVPGGYLNSALGLGSFAAGRNARVTHQGSFMWSDGTVAASTGNNSFEVVAGGAVNFFNGSGGVNIDMYNRNIGDINFGLRFGAGSGEGIGSKRNAGGNLYGLDFYTGFYNRMSIAQNGNVGIGTDSPSQKLQVNGTFMMVTGDGNEQAYLGGDGYGGDVQVGSLNPGIQNVAFYNAGSGAYMQLICKALTIVGGADLAEPFEMSSKEIPEGSVVVIDEENPGQLKMSRSAYDTHVAGIVSGAGGIHPGIQLKQNGTLENGQNVALTGRVYALADASSGPIKPGDLLTTSSIPGHCMKARDRDQAQGAILGKAMTGLKEGKGKVLVLVTLQ